MAETIKCEVCGKEIPAERPGQTLGTCEGVCRELFAKICTRDWISGNNNKRTAINFTSINDRRKKVFLKVANIDLVEGFHTGKVLDNEEGYDVYGAALLSGYTYIIVKHGKALPEKLAAQLDYNV